MTARVHDEVFGAHHVNLTGADGIFDMYGRRFNGVEHSSNGPPLVWQVCAHPMSPPSVPQR